MENTNRSIIELKEFRNTVNCIYIYGAGKYAKYAHLTCNDLGIQIKGFITTKYEKDEYCGLPVFVVNQIKETDDTVIGVIPGFVGFSPEVCKQIGRRVCLFKADLDFFKYYCTIFLVRKNLVRRIAESFPNDNNQDKHNLERVKKIMVVRLDAIGDLVCTTPLFRVLKENFTEAEVSAVIQKGNRAVLEYNPYIDKVFEYEGNKYDVDNNIDLDSVVDIVNSAKEFIKDQGLSNDYQIVIMPMFFLEGRNAFLTTAVSKALSSGMIVSWVKSDEQTNMFQKKIAEELPCKIFYVNTPMHEKDYILTMMKELNITVRSNKLQIFFKQDSYIDSVMNKEEGVIYIAVGVVGSEDRKTWKSENYKELFVGLIGRNIRFVLFGASDAVSASEIIGEGSNVISLVNKTSLSQTIYAVSKCDMYLGSNTGLLHIAVALDKPCVTLYAASKEASPWDGMGPVRWGAQGVPHIDLLPDHCIDDCRISCSKSYSHCINQITIEEVENAICALLKE